MFKERPLDTLFSRDLLQMLLLLFGHMLQAQYLKSDKEAKTANSHCTLASFQQFSGLLRQKMVTL